jgi:glucan phosphoethanolaminetransferase (alkaline phosphatase superfamily)
MNQRATRKPRWLPLVSAAVHLGLATLIIGSIMIVVLDSGSGEDSAGLIGSWIRSVERVAESLAMERRRPYVASMLCAFVLLPLAVGWWHGRRLRREQDDVSLGLVALLSAVVCVVLYAATVQILTSTSAVSLTVMARNHVWFSHFIVAAYSVLYIPVAVVAAQVVHLVCRGPQDPITTETTS